MMIKKAFSDGLLQIAIVLSLLRTDWNNYLNSINDYHSYPEVQDIILGPLAGITQTDFHNHGAWQQSYLGGYAHHKNIDSYYSNEALRDLHDLTHYPRFSGIQTNVEAWLINDPTTVKLPSESADTNNNNQESPNTNGDENPVEADDDPVGAVSVNYDNLVDSQHFPGGDLTKEDMDLIDVLWRQDIDLGVGREMFDVALRKELEQERERELHKQREEEFLEHEKIKLEEQLQQSFPPGSYTVDSETGELVFSQDEPKNDQSPNQVPDLEPNEGLSIEETMQLLRETQFESSENVTNVDGSNQTGFSLVDLVQSTTSVSPDMPQVIAPFGRQNSIEQRWEDVNSLLSLEHNNSASNTQFFASSDAYLQTQQPGYPDNALVQNATMPMDVNQGEYMTDSFGSQESFQASNTFSAEDGISLLTPNADSQLMNVSTIFPNLTQTGLNPSQPGINLSQPSINLPQPGANLPQAGINISQPSMNMTEDAELLGSSLLELLDAAEDMNELDITELDPYFPSHATHPRLLSDSSDSAISMTESVEMDSSDALSSSSSSSSGCPFEGIEGATGGSEQGDSHTTASKQEDFFSDYSMEQFSYGSASIQTNHSYNGNASVSPQPSPELLSRHVKHNHSYPLQPGQSPRERASPNTASLNMANSTSSGKKSSASPAHITRETRKLKEAKIPFSVEDIIDSSVEMFNDMLQKFSFSERQLQLIKDVRRRGKNKVAAQNCRKRKMEVIQTLEDEVAVMKSQRDEMARQRKALQKELGHMKAKFGSLYEEVFNSLRDENGKPYDPEKYVLKQTDDGNVFLVAKSDSDQVPKGHKTKGSRKRKTHRND